MKRSLLSLTIAAAAVSDLTAQACSFGPGELFGVVAYQCANCGFKREKPDRPSYLFYAEPVITEVKSPGVFRVGDVVEAVDGKPITTTAGADAFTYPGTGDHEIAVRRGRVRQALQVSITGSGCDATTRPSSSTQIQLPKDDIEKIEVFKGPAAVPYGSPPGGVVVISTRPNASATPAARDSIRAQLRDVFGTPGAFEGRPQPIIIVDGIRVSPDLAAALAPLDRTGRFGFAVECKPSCVAATTKEGTLRYIYYRYDAFPPVAAIRPGGAAERAGLKVGDLVTKVDGHSIRDEEGARILAKLDRQDKLSLTVLRGDKELVISIVP
jgi:hypothetical protein